MGKGRDIMWKQQMVNTKRGTFELLLKAVANRFALHITIRNLMRLVITLRMFSLLRIVYCSLIYEMLVTQQKPVENELSMIETIHDLEAIREALQLPIWHFAGHSTGGMLGLLYAITYPKSLQSLVVVEPQQVTILKHHFVFIIRNILSFIICNSSSKI